MPLLNLRTAIGLGEFAYSMLTVKFPRTFVYVAVGISHNSSSILVVIHPVTSISISIGLPVFPISMFQIPAPASDIETAVLVELAAEATALALVPVSEVSLVTARKQKSADAFAVT